MIAATNTKKLYVRRIAVVAFMSALGFVLMLLEFPLPFIIPEFVKFDFSEVPSLLTAYMYGPVEGVVVCLIKNLLKLPFTTTGGVGELCNFLLGASLALPAGLFFKRLQSRKSLLIGSIIGAVIMALLSLPLNYYVSYPIYTKFLPIDAIVEMYQRLIPSVDGLFQCLLIFNVPFTLLKGVASSLVAYLISRKVRIAPNQSSTTP